MTSQRHRESAGPVATVCGGLGGCSQPQATSEPIRVSEGYALTPDSVRLWYRVVGSGPDVVIVPNALFHRERLDTLASATRRIVLYDPRGRGRSDSIPPASASLARA
ncbi:MAG TPA: hypothetical protein VJ717_10530 [Gemmatimonadaceae bacterium]|nr:hypothetical protein [Gemmatimonadaceae bacterium]